MNTATKPRPSCRQGVPPYPLDWIDPAGLGPWGESGPFADQFSESGPVLNPGAHGLRKPTPDTLPPINTGKGRGEFYFASHTLTFDVPVNGKTRKDLKNELVKHLQRFDLFNRGRNTVATVHLSSDGSMATFNMLGVQGYGVDEIGNADAVPVGLTYIADDQVVRADTREGHMLEGVRIWTAWVGTAGAGSGHYRVTLYTSAIDRKVGVVNDVGAWAAGTKEQEKIWDQYLHNIADAYDGSSREMCHERRKATKGTNPFEALPPGEDNRISN